MDEGNDAYAPKYVHLQDASVRRAVEGLIRPEFKDGFYLAEMVRKADGSWLLVLEPDISARLGRGTK